ncbi:uncharacterized protein LOC115881360 isoform X2 [Sitophilus oryzae]|uniref:Uncharacterized protein LOC115881360 isoform X2 n=1 Tax=Sitophilus oryzae TaxID=7048 RepID=A0A6J2XT26_SITOR|nr:uncharacterized protein LOC115881360 isoform X2 [Sitophilus oryzae]
MSARSERLLSRRLGSTIKNSPSLVNSTSKCKTPSVSSCFQFDSRPVTNEITSVPSITKSTSKIGKKGNAKVSKNLLDAIQMAHFNAQCKKKTRRNRRKADDDNSDGSGTGGDIADDESVQLSVKKKTRKVRETMNYLSNQMLISDDATNMKFKPKKIKRKAPIFSLPVNDILEDKKTFTTVSSENKENETTEESTENEVYEQKNSTSRALRRKRKNLFHMIDVDSPNSDINVHVMYNNPPKQERKSKRNGLDIKGFICNEDTKTYSLRNVNKSENKNVMKTPEKSHLEKIDCKSINKTNSSSKVLNKTSNNENRSVTEHNTNSGKKKRATFEKEPSNIQLELFGQGKESTEKLVKNSRMSSDIWKSNTTVAKNKRSTFELKPELSILLKESSGKPNKYTEEQDKNSGISNCNSSRKRSTYNKNEEGNVEPKEYTELTRKSISCMQNVDHKISRYSNNRKPSPTPQKTTFETSNSGELNSNLDFDDNELAGSRRDTYEIKYDSSGQEWISQNLDTVNTEHQMSVSNLTSSVRKSVRQDPRLSSRSLNFKTPVQESRISGKRSINKNTCELRYESSDPEWISQKTEDTVNTEYQMPVGNLTTSVRKSVRQDPRLSSRNLNLKTPVQESRISGKHSINNDFRKISNGICLDIVQDHNIPKIQITALPKKTSNRSKSSISSAKSIGPISIEDDSVFTDDTSMEVSFKRKSNKATDILDHLNVTRMESRKSSFKKISREFSTGSDDEGKRNRFVTIRRRLRTWDTRRSLNISNGSVKRSVESQNSLSNNVKKGSKNSHSFVSSSDDINSYEVTRSSAQMEPASKKSQGYQSVPEINRKDTESNDEFFAFLPNTSKSDLNDMMLENIDSMVIHNSFAACPNVDATRRLTRDSTFVKDELTTESPAKRRSSRKRWSQVEKTPIFNKVYTEPLSQKRGSAINKSKSVSFITPPKSSPSRAATENKKKSVRIESPSASTPKMRLHSPLVIRKTPGPKSLQSMDDSSFLSDNHTSTSTRHSPPSSTSTPYPHKKEESLLKTVLNNEGTKNDSINKSFKRAKMPNFKKIHQRQYEKMENLQQLQERKALRAQTLMSGSKPPQSTSLIRNDVDKESRKMLKFGPEKDTSSLNNSSKTLSKPQQKLLEKRASLEKKKKDLRSKLPVKAAVKNQVAQVQINQTKPKAVTRFGFKFPENKKVTKEEQIRAVTNKSKIGSDRREETRKQLQGVRSNRRFELLMKMRQNKK